MARDGNLNLLTEGLPPAAQDRTDQPPHQQVDHDGRLSIGMSVTVWQ
ncbi:hypothetical protein M2160_000420 [Streptomyces sp. SAI-117]|nr:MULTISPECIES: hypothetical protein [unclassified Streptomyces]MDH6546303.1 hypothetical protein [Streptomyces sp. SAI-041]MDH6565399.1 hypothetical protein [Streptomyces sp. SAI-117]